MILPSAWKSWLTTSYFWFIRYPRDQRGRKWMSLFEV